MTTILIYGDSSTWVITQAWPDCLSTYQLLWYSFLLLWQWQYCSYHPLLVNITILIQYRSTYTKVWNYHMYEIFTSLQYPFFLLSMVIMIDVDKLSTQALPLQLSKLFQHLHVMYSITHLYSVRTCAARCISYVSLPVASYCASRLTIWWSRTTPCYYVQDVLLSILKCYRTTVTLSHRCRPTLWCAVGDNSTQWQGRCAQWVNTVMIAVTMVTETTKEVECITHCSTAISTYSQWRSSTCWLVYPVSSLTVEHLHTGYKPSLVSTVVYPWHTVHQSRPHVHVTTDTNGLV